MNAGLGRRAGTLFIPKINTALTACKNVGSGIKLATWYWHLRYINIENLKLKFIGLP